MRAQLRTYHSIPSLQARQDPNAYKQLQDAPRLKSILKGATEDEEQPSTVEDIKNHPVPRTNPVNLIFVLSQYAPKISELHFFPPRDFFDLVMRPNLSSRSRATAFLWLMWWYLESDFSKEAAESNPFGPGQYGPPGDPATAGHPIKCPAFDFLTPEQEALENVDTTEEKNFGEIKRKERIGTHTTFTRICCLLIWTQLFLVVTWRRSLLVLNATVKRVSPVSVILALSPSRLHCRQFNIAFSFSNKCTHPITTSPDHI
jgi:hypothetical protein